MTQSQINRAVSRATGESAGLVDTLGFHLVKDNDADVWPEGDPLIGVDCPFCGSAVLLAVDPEDLPVCAQCGECQVAFDYSSDEIYSVPLETIPRRVRRSFVPAA